MLTFHTQKRIHIVMADYIVSKCVQSVSVSINQMCCDRRHTAELIACLEQFG